MDDGTNTSHPLISDYLQDLLLDTVDVEEFLNELVRFSVSALSEGPEFLCGITLLRHKKVGTVASSSEQAQKTDEIQYQFDDGPCLRANREQQTVHIPDMHNESRQPAYTPIMVWERIRSSVAVAFDLAGDARAALNVYSDRPHRFDRPLMEIIEDHVRQTSKAFRLAVRLAQRTDNAAPGSQLTTQT
ncbi:GAF domain-containing protein [Arthrobacter sp. Sr33]